MNVKENVKLALLLHHGKHNYVTMTTENASDTIQKHNFQKYMLIIYLK